MNRSERRKRQKIDNMLSKEADNETKRLINKILQPCCYVNNEPLYNGSAVFLKKDIEILDQYNWNLNRLIEQNHRFVIQMNMLKIGSPLVVSLLSTSRFLNEEQRLGIRLSGNYHKNKYVYMDAKNSYVITPDCIKCLDYKLTDDVSKCTTIVRSNLYDIILHKGLLYNNKIDKAYDWFNKNYYMNKFSEEDQKAINTLYVADFVKQQSYEAIKISLTELKKKYPNTIKEAYEVLTESQPNITGEEFDRQLLALILATTDDLNITTVSKYMQRGYK